MARSSAKLFCVTNNDSTAVAHEHLRVVPAAGGARSFPAAETTPRMPVMIPDEKLDYCGWIFRQGGFANMNMTFEQFLMVVAAVNPLVLSRQFDEDAADFSCDSQ